MTWKASGWLVHDARGPTPLRYRYNAPCWQERIDGGTGRMLVNAAGEPFRHWDADSLLVSGTDSADAAVNGRLAQLLQFQYADHLGSVGLEPDGEGR